MLLGTTVSTEIPPKRHILTVALEDYFQVGAFNRLIQRGQWYRFETRFEQNTLRVLDLLDEYQITATFFVLGWIAERQPEIVKEVARRGHEIANRGYYHRSTREMSPAEFKYDLSRTRDILENATGRRVVGYRVAHQVIGPPDLWALEVLAEQGYAYDSSMMPLLRSFHGEPWRRFVHRYNFGKRVLWEYPLSTCNVLGYNIPIAGGNYIRQFPHSVVKRLVDRWDHTYDAPFVMYFHVWELDPEQARINAGSWLSRVRQYRNLDKMEEILADYFRKFRFTGIAEHLGINLSPPAKPENSIAKSNNNVACVRRPEVQPSTGEPKTASRLPVTIVVPCYNEELILPYVANTLRSVESTLGQDYDLHFTFVDDGSVDSTWRALKEAFGGKQNCAILRHPKNLGVAASILTGIRSSSTEIVCSIDCDCTYDPHELEKMIPLLEDGIDMVTASPYHPQGRVLNVPTWRLCLSKGCSALYRRVLRRNWYTYTSCLRVYRRSSVADLQLKSGGFLGIAEMLGLLALRNAGIVEYPATLEVRMLGRSKMRTLRTIAGHFRLLMRLLLMRAFSFRDGRECQTVLSKGAFHSGVHVASNIAVGPGCVRPYPRRGGNRTAR
jgi:polysaccharide deacetylase family protein (PEP-CTERM system associated)